MTTGRPLLRARVPSAPVGFDPTDAARVRPLRAWLLAAFTAVAVLADIPVVLGAAGMTPQPALAPLVVVQVLVMVLAAWRRGRLGDRAYTLAQLVGAVTATPLLVASLVPGSQRAAETVMLVPAVMAAVFCRTRAQAATVVAATTVGAVLVSLHRTLDPAEATSQAVGLAICFTLIAAVIRSLRDSAERALQAARHGEITDPLTGTLNRRGFERSGASTWTRAAESGQVLAVLALDLDHFKTVNDTLGHAAGDRILEQVGARLRAEVRGGDLAVRLGGEEFALLCTVAPGQGVVVAERLRASVAAHVPATVSVGVVEISPAPDVQDVVAQLWATVSSADERMYAAKQAGRDRVVGAPA